MCASPARSTRASPKKGDSEQAHVVVLIAACAPGRSGRACVRNGRSLGAPTEPVEPYPVLTLACNGGPLRAVHGSEPPLGHLSSGRC
jgi:hypothetical protein